MELKACPFCGGGMIRCSCDESNCGRLECKDCGVEILWSPEGYKDNVKYFNTRTPDPLAEKVAIEAGYFAAFACDDWETHDCNNCRLKRAIEQYQKAKGIDIESKG